MAREDQYKWDRRHSTTTGAQEPAALLRLVLESNSWVVARGEALDIAAGKGRNARYLARQGFSVTALDVSPVALSEAERLAVAEALRIEWQQADLATHRLPANAFDLVVCFNFLQRSLLPQVKQAVKVGGHVVYETYLIDQRTLGHPKNPDYLLRHNELLESFAGFRILYYREGEVGEGIGRSFRASLCARRLR